MPAGRPEKPIDWNLVDKLLEAQNTAAEIAGHFDIDPSTLFRKSVEKWGTNFENYARSRYSKGKSNIKLMQYKKAMDGSIQMLIKLGEIYCEQNSKQIQLNLIELDEFIKEETQADDQPTISIGQTLEIEPSILDKGQAREKDTVQTELGSNTVDTRPSSSENSTEG